MMLSYRMTEKRRTIKPVIQMQDNMTNTRRVFTPVGFNRPESATFSWLGVVDWSACGTEALLVVGDDTVDVLPTFLLVTVASGILFFLYALVSTYF